MLGTNIFGEAIRLGGASSWKILSLYYVSLLISFWPHDIYSFAVTILLFHFVPAINWEGTFSKGLAKKVSLVISAITLVYCQPIFIILAHTLEEISHPPCRQCYFVSLSSKSGLKFTSQLQQTYQTWELKCTILYIWRCEIFSSVHTLSTRI